LEDKDTMPGRDEALDYRYDDAGNLLSSEVLVVVCTATPDGAVDPTTERQYGALCQHLVDGKPCHSKNFKEDQQRSVMVCASCGGFFGYRIHSREETM